MIYHIISKSHWEQSREWTHYQSDSLKLEGFMHCSNEDQVLRSANKHFKGEAKLIVLLIEETRLEADLIWENTSGGTENFPHLYGPLNLDAVLGIRVLARDKDERFCFQPDPSHP